jgi:hypothetical protein
VTRNRTARRLSSILAIAAIAMTFTATPASAETDPADAPTLAEALSALPVAIEVRAGYDRDLFRHWVDADRDGCKTRQEVLIAEAVEAPVVDAVCKIGDGRWYSYYDDVYVDNPRGLDIDHLVPLAEAWDSGASGWDPGRREAYANDIGHEIPLIAVTARSNRSKSDQDPAEWMPPSEAATCRYVYEWISVKTRWSLSIDSVEAEALTGIVADCPEMLVTIPLA